MIGNPSEFFINLPSYLKVLFWTLKEPDEFQKAIELKLLVQTDAHALCVHDA